MLEPSLTTRGDMVEDRVRGRRLSPRIELELDSGDLDVVSRLEPLGLERPDHPNAAQAPLQMGQRFVVVEVVACHQPLDAGAGDPPAVLTAALHSVSPARGRAASRAS